MTDYDKFKALFDEMGIPYDEGRNEQPNWGGGPSPYLLLEVGSHKKVVGYTGFACFYYFTDNGDFNKVGIYE